MYRNLAAVPEEGNPEARRSGNLNSEKPGRDGDRTRAAPGHFPKRARREAHGP
jgi:hypothetical protein